MTHTHPVYGWAGPGSVSRGRWACWTTSQPGCSPLTRCQWTWSSPETQTHKRWEQLAKRATQSNTDSVTLAQTYLWVEHDFWSPVPTRGHVLGQETCVVVLRVGYPRQAKVTDLRISRRVRGQQLHVSKMWPTFKTCRNMKKAVHVFISNKLASNKIAGNVRAGTITVQKCCTQCTVE